MAKQNYIREIDRRTFIRWGLATAGMSLLPLNGNASVRNAIAPAVTGTGPQKHYDLTIANSTVNFSGKPAKAVTVNGTLPGPLLHFREGEEVTIDVTNTLPEITSVHWHGLVIPNDQDGVPGITFPGIQQGETFHYRFTPRHNGTYWYHSHAILQEPEGFYGAIIIDAKEPEPFAYDREYVVLLSDWNDTPAKQVLANLKKVEGYYNYRRQTLLDLRKQLGAAKTEEERASIWRERLMWAQMRMDPTDITDGGPEWQFLMHGQTIENNWTALFNRGERIRLRFINGAAMNFFDVSIPGLTMTVVASDGLHVQPIDVNEFRIGIGETYDVIVTPTENKAYTIFAGTTGCIGFARGTLAPESLYEALANNASGIEAPIPDQGPQPVLTMADMAGVHDHSAHTSPSSDANAHTGHTPAPAPATHDHAAMNHSAHDHHAMLMAAAAPSPTEKKFVEKLTYADLRALTASTDKRTPTQIIEMKLTGDMHRYFWSINGKKMSRENFFNAKRNERLQFVITNTTMMEHPMHVHGAFFQLEMGEPQNGPSDFAPRKHTLIVKPGQTVNLFSSFEENGVWMFHCHLAYHALAGMMQAVVITDGDAQTPSTPINSAEHNHEHH
ncbi:MAG: multicopper oxidase domain-containing protein [Spongiibacteraceae bacterium]